MLFWKNNRTTKAPHKKINLILNASGVRAPCFIGALEAIQDKGYTIERIAGSSGGAVVAAGFALGKNLTELKKLAPLTPYRKFKDFNVKNLLSITNPSVYSGKPLDTFYKTVFGNSKLKDFQIDCKIAVVTILGRERILLDKNNYPELEVWKAVRMSSTIPFIFPYLELEGVPVTDGALVVNLFDIFEPGPGLLVTLNPKSDYGLKKAIQQVKGHRIFIWDYLKVLAEYFLDAVDNRHIPQEEWGKTITIPTFEVGGFNFELTEREVEKLVNYGYNAVSSSKIL